MSRFLFYPHIRGVLNRLPEHYKGRYVKKFEKNTKISYIKKDDDAWKQTATGHAFYPAACYEVEPELIFPQESQKALWGGEGIVKGFLEVKRTHTRIPKTWAPELEQHLFYSEVLDRWMKVIVSTTALKQIEDLKGFDNYILSTPENEINSRLGMHIKREMLLKLADEDFRRQNDKVFTKFAAFAIPQEEAQWIGLTLDEAIKKQLKIEHSQIKMASSVPKKISLAKELIEKLDGEASLKKSAKSKEQSSPTSSKGGFSVKSLFHGNEAQT